MHNFGRVMMALAVDVSHFEGVLMAPPDPILGVSEAFKADKNDLKLNLGIGAYRTEELQPYVLNVVKKAENLMLEKGENKEYLPIEGLAAFKKATADLLFGDDNPVIKERRVATLQSLSGTGSLRLAVAFIQRYFPEAKYIYHLPPGGFASGSLDEVMKMHFLSGFLLSVAWKCLLHSLTARTLVYMQKELEQ